MNPQFQLMFEQALHAFQGGYVDRADSLLTKIISLDKKNPNVLHLLGLIRASQGNFKEAVDLLTKAAQIDPHDGFIQYNLAKALVDSGQILESLPHHIKAVELVPNNPDAWINYGKTVSSLKRYEEAIGHYDRALSLKQDYLEAWINKGIALHELKRYEEAIAHYDRALELSPDYVEAWTNKGAILHELKRYEEALAHYDRALELGPDYVEAWTNKGITLQELKRYEEALTSYDKAISLKPDYHEAWSNQGVTLNELKRYEDALASYDKAISIKSDYYDAYWNKALTQLVTGNFKDGWKNYEYRWKKNKADPMRHKHYPTLINLNGISGKSVLVWSEQGYGDTVQFSRFIEKLIELEASVIFEVQEPLKALFKQSFTRAKIISQDEAFGNIDFQIPLLSLPLLFCINAENIPSKKSYIQVSKNNIIYWRKKLNIENKKINIGVACSGNINNINDKKRSIDLKFFEQIANQANLFIIQKELRKYDIDFLIKYKKITFLGNEIKSFSDSAAIIQIMDLVITVDTSIAHLSSAIGKPTFILLPWSPEWRWLIDRKDSPWYPTAKIFRQPNLGNWEEVIKKIILQLNLDY